MVNIPYYCSKSILRSTVIMSINQISTHPIIIYEDENVRCRINKRKIYNRNTACDTDGHCCCSFPTQLATCSIVVRVNSESCPMRSLSSVIFNVRRAERKRSIT